MDIYAITIAISLLLYLGIGQYAGRRVKHLEDYFVVGRNAPTLFIVGTLVASVLSTNAFLGETGFSYASQGGAYILWPAIWVLGYLYGAVFFGRYLRRSRALTVAQFFGHRFNSQKVQAAAGVTIILGVGGYLLAVTQGLAVILSQLTPLDYHQALVLAWLCYTLFTFYSGSQGVILTDTLMFFIFTVMSFIALYYIVDAHGTWVQAVGELVKLESKPQLMTWHGEVGEGTAWQTPKDFLIWSVITGVAWSLVAAVSPWQSSRYLMAKSEHVVLRSACIAAIVIAASNVALFAAATVVNLSKDDIFPHEQVMVWAAMNMMPEIAGALLLAGVLAAALSSATTFLSLIGFSVSQDIVSSKTKDDKSLLRYSRMTMLGVGTVALFIAFFIPADLFWLVYYVGTVFASSWGPVAFMIIWSDTITAKAAYWGIISGFVGNVLSRTLDSFNVIDLPAILNPILIGGVLSLSVIVVISRYSRVTEIERSRRLALHQNPEIPATENQRRWTQAVAWLVILFGILMTVLQLEYFVEPYQQASSVFGEHSWLSMETLFAGGWSVLFGLGGMLMLFVVKRPPPMKTKEESL